MPDEASLEAGGRDGRGTSTNDSPPLSDSSRACAERGGAGDAGLGVSIEVLEAEQAAVQHGSGEQDADQPVAGAHGGSARDSADDLTSLMDGFSLRKPAESNRVSTPFAAAASQDQAAMPPGTAALEGAQSVGKEGSKQQQQASRSKRKRTCVVS